MSSNMQVMTFEEYNQRQQAKREYWQKRYPNARIDESFLIKASIAQNEDKPCKSCKGYPCAKKTNQGQRSFIVGENTILNLYSKPCKYAAVYQNSRVANIPPMYKNKTFGDYKIDAGNANAVKGAQLLQGLYIFGAPGTGKTFLASIMANELLKQGKTVMFTDTPTLLDEMRNTFDRESEATLEHIMLKLAKVDVLVLDDLGTEKPTEWAVEKLYQVVNERYNAEKMLIVTSNYDLQMVAEKLNHPIKKKSDGDDTPNVTGSRIASRIRGLCKVAQISGADKRRA